MAKIGRVLMCRLWDRGNLSLKQVFSTSELLSDKDILLLLEICLKSQQFREHANLEF